MFQVFFLVDGNEEIGMGHLIRCRLLARKFRELGGFCTFLTSVTNISLLQALQTEGFGVKTLSSRQAKDPNSVLAKIGDQGSLTRMLVVDSHISDFYETDFQHSIRRGGLLLMMITFIHDYHFVADVVHNQNLLAFQHDYNIEPYTNLLLGPVYAILADAFQYFHEERRDIAPRVRTILVSFGGADRTNQTKKVVVALAAMKTAPPDLIIVGGPLYGDIDGLRALVSKESHLNTELYINTAEMPKLMARCDLAITSGGSTLWELACIGVPTLVISTSEPERKTGLLLEQRGICRYLGHHDQVSQKQIKHAVADYSNNREERREMVQNGKRLVDGLGIQRVMDYLMAALGG